MKPRRGRRRPFRSETYEEMCRQKEDAIEALADLVHEADQDVRQVARLFMANPGLYELQGLTIGSRFWDEKVLPVIAAMTEDDLSVRRTERAIFGLLELQFPDDEEKLP